MSLAVQTSLSADVTSLSVEGFFLFGGFARCKFAGASFVSTAEENTAQLAPKWVAGATINAEGLKNYVAVVKNVSALAKDYTEVADITVEGEAKFDYLYIGVSTAEENTAQLASKWVAGATIDAEGAQPPATISKNYVAVVKNVSALAKDIVEGAEKFDYLYIGVSTAEENTAQLALNWVAGATINAEGAKNYVAVVKNVSALAKDYTEVAKITAQLAPNWVAGEAKFDYLYIGVSTASETTAALALNWVAGATTNTEGAKNYVAVVKNVSALAKDIVEGAEKFDYLYIGVSTASETTAALAPKWVAGATIDVAGEAKFDYLYIGVSTAEEITVAGEAK